MWWWIWTIGAAALLVGGFFLARRIVRSARALGATVARAGEAIERFGARVADLSAEPPAAAGPTLWDERTELRGRVAAGRARRGARRAARTKRNRGVVVKWRDFNG